MRCFLSRALRPVALLLPLVLMAAACDSGGDNGNESGPNASPTAQFSYTPDSPTPGTEIQFDASASSDEDGSIVSYKWTFSDDATASGPQTTRVYEESARNRYGQDSRYEVTLTVTDDAGATTTTSKIVVIPPEERTVTWEKVWGDEFEGDGLPDAEAVDGLLEVELDAAVLGVVDALETYLVDGHVEPVVVVGDGDGRGLVERLAAQGLKRHLRGLVTAGGARDALDDAEL